MSIYKFGNFKAKIDVTDVEFVKRFQMLADNYEGKLKDLPLCGSAVQAVEAACKVFYNIFDELIGEGAAEKMFGGKMSVNACIKAFKKLIRLVKIRRRIIRFWI